MVLHAKKMQVARAVCLNARCVSCVVHGSWAAENLLYTAMLRQAVGSGDPSVDRLTAVSSGQWILPWGSGLLLLLCSTSLPGVSGQWNSVCVLPHYLGAVGSGTPFVHCLTALGQWAPCVHCLTALGQWAVELFPFTASLPWGSGQWNCFCCVVLCCVVLCCVVLWCVVPKALLPKGKRPGCLPTGKGKRAGLCVLCARRA